MNQDQIFSQIRTLLKIGGTWAVTNGYMSNSHAELVAGIIFAIVGVLWSHVTHQADDAAAGSQGKLPGLNLLFILLIPAFLVSGCAGFTGNAYKAEKTAQVSVDAAMHAWNDYIGQFHPSIAAQIKVRDAFRKYQQAELLAIDTTAAYASNQTDANRTAAQTAANVVSASISDLIGLVQSFGVKL